MRRPRKVPDRDAIRPGRRGSAAVAACLTLGILPLVTGCAGPPRSIDEGTVTATAREVLPAPSDADAQRRGLAETVLGAHLRAAQDADLAAWLAPVRGAGLRQRQREVFARIQLIGVTDLRLAAVTLTKQAGAGWTVHARADYRISGHDRTPRTFELDVNLTPPEGPTAPGTKSQDAHAVQITSWQPAPRPEPWDLDGLVVRRTGDALVLAGSAERADQIARLATLARRDVAAVWGTSSAAVWVAPVDDVTAGRLLGDDAAALEGVASVTDGPLEVGSPAGADRVVVLPGAWDSLTEQGRLIVMTHELTHVSVRASTTRPVPLWLSEGFAELVAYRRVNLPETVVAASALRRFGTGALPTGLPEAADFATGGGRLAAAYGSSLLAVRTLADEDGEAALVRVYTDVARAGDGRSADALADADSRLDEALAAVLGTTRAALVQRWRARISALLR